MKLINIIESKDPRRLTFEHKHKPLAEEVEQAVQSHTFIMGVIQDSLEDEELDDEGFEQLEYIRIVLAKNRDDVIEKANYYAREVNKMLVEKVT